MMFFYLISLKPSKLFFNIFSYFNSINDSVRFFELIKLTGHVKFNLNKINLKRLFYYKFQFTNKNIWNTRYVNWFTYYFNTFYFFNLIYSNTRLFPKFKTKLKFEKLFNFKKSTQFTYLQCKKVLKYYNFFNQLISVQSDTAVPGYYFALPWKVKLYFKPLSFSRGGIFLNSSMFWNVRLLNILNLNFNNRIGVVPLKRKLFILPIWGYTYLNSFEGQSLNNKQNLTKSLVFLNKNASIFIKLYYYRLYIFKKFIFSKKNLFRKMGTGNLNSYTGNMFSFDSVKRIGRACLSNSSKSINIFNSTKFNKFFYLSYDTYPNVLRLKFKPGYSIIWRAARRSFKKIFNLSFTYQHQLTKYLLLFNKISGFTLLKKFELNILNILIRSRFFLNFDIIKVFINNNFIWVNGFQVKALYFQLYLNDIIQINFSWKYFIYFKWLLNVSQLKFNKVNWKYNIKLSNLKFRQKNYKMRRAPRWVESNIYLYLDIPNYLEVDFLSLSIYIIYEPYTKRDINSVYLQFFSFNVMNLYNWKYIT